MTGSAARTTPALHARARSKNRDVALLDPQVAREKWVAACVTVLACDEAPPSETSRAARPRSRSPCGWPGTVEAAVQRFDPFFDSAWASVRILGACALAYTSSKNEMLDVLKWRSTFSIIDLGRTRPISARRPCFTENQPFLFTQQLLDI